MVSISQEQFEQARAAAAQSPVVVSAVYSRRKARLEIGFASGVELAVPVALIQELQTLVPPPAPALLAEVEVWGGGQSVYFPQLDVSVWAPGLLQGVFGTREWMRTEVARAMGSAKSPAKAAAARENGRKGGRPRRQREEAAGHEAGQAAWVPA